MAAGSFSDCNTEIASNSTLTTNIFFSRVRVELEGVKNKSKDEEDVSIFVRFQLYSGHTDADVSFVNVGLCAPTTE